MRETVGLWLCRQVFLHVCGDKDTTRASVSLLPQTVTFRASLSNLPCGRGHPRDRDRGAGLGCNLLGTSSEELGGSGAGDTAQLAEPLPRRRESPAPCKQSLVAHACNPSSGGRGSEIQGHLWPI